jgi:pseudouridine synthase
VKVKGVPRETEIERMKNGMTVGGISYLPCRARLFRREEKNTWLEIQIMEGKKRQVRNMCEALGHTVMKLKRTAIGAIRLGGLERGRWRELKKWEIEWLKRNTVCGKGGADES